MEMSAAVPATAWQNGRFRTRAGPRKLLFGCMYEDAEIELGAFQPGGRIFCIASAGCTAMRLAAHHSVVAVDINPVQVAYVQRRLGGGSLQRGSAERMLDFARTLAPIAGWNRRTVRAFLDLDDPKQQIVYWRRHLDTRRFRAAFAFLFSRLMLRSVYSAAFLDCLPPNFGMVLRARMERCFALHPNRTNPYARTLLLGEMRSAQDAPELRKFNFDAPTRPIFLKASQPGVLQGFLFRTSWMEPTQRTRNDYSLRCSTPLRLERWSCCVASANLNLYRERIMPPKIEPCSGALLTSVPSRRSDSARSP